MVLPIIIASGITILAITIKFGTGAFRAYKKLTPLMIMKLNNISLDYSGMSGFPSKYHSRLTESLQQELEQYYGGFNKTMTEIEAMMILDIKDKDIKRFDIEMLKKRHRLSMIKNHSDRGGSPYIAMKINEAREVLEKSVLIRK